uniref:C2H2-type domain-containing protein n=1 Tax=Mycena chlorophos TaxID=658473 RepID=A0ABQ0M3V4_MYCCL|nr:predicted protein [Mycena chlorophos]
MRILNARYTNPSNLRCKWRCTHCNCAAFKDLIHLIDHIVAEHLSDLATDEALFFRQCSTAGDGEIVLVSEEDEMLRCTDCMQDPTLLPWQQQRVFGDAYKFQEHQSSNKHNPRKTLIRLLRADGKDKKGKQRVTVG